MTADPKATAEYIAARASESLSYGDLAYAQSQGWCLSSPDGMGPHRPDDTTDPVTCAECGATLDEREARLARIAAVYPEAAAEARKAGKT